MVRGGLSLTGSDVSLTYRILPHRGLVYVRYEGHASVAETASVFERYLADPDWRLGQKQLVDVTAVTSFDRDALALMALQARQVDAFRPTGAVQTLLVYLAPGDVGFDMAMVTLVAWRGWPAFVVSVQRDAAAALDILGQPERDIPSLLAAAR